MVGYLEFFLKIEERTKIPSLLKLFTLHSISKMSYHLLIYPVADVRDIPLYEGNVRLCYPKQ